MKYYAIFFGTCFALGGCVIETKSTGTAGDGGTGGSTGGTGGATTSGTGAATTSTGGATTSSTGGATTGTGGTGGSTATCVSCAEYVTPGLNPGDLPVCDGTSKDLYTALADCTCNGACKDKCTDNVCADPPAAISADCQACVSDTAAGCGTAFNDCSNDAG